METNKEGGLLVPVLVGAAVVGGLLLWANSSKAESKEAPATTTPGPVTCPVTDDVLAQFKQTTGKTFNVEAGPTSALTPGLNTSARVFSKADCSFYGWSGSQWITDDESNGQILTFLQNRPLAGHPASLFLF